MTDRFDRNERFFGRAGQKKISESRVAIVGVGGLGTHVVQQLALLGVGHLALIDPEELDSTNLNRYVGARHDDPIPGTLKVDIGERLAKSINADIIVDAVPDSFLSNDAYDAIDNASYVFGCVDTEGARLLLNEITAAYNRTYIDLASEIHSDQPLTYGGRVCISQDGEGCLICLGVLDIAEAQIDLSGPQARYMRNAIYGLDRDLLDERGPSVVSINGTVASLAVTEFMVAVTDIRKPIRLLNYYGHSGKVVVSSDKPTFNCFYCAGTRQKGDTTSIRDYLTVSSLSHLRKKFD